MNIDVMKRHARSIALGLGLLAVIVGGIGYAVHRRHATAPHPIALELSQSVSRDFDTSLEALIAPYLAAHPDVTVHVRYEAFPSSKALSAKDAHIALRPLAPGDAHDAVPLFASDYMVLAFNRAMVDAAPTTWPALIARATALKEQGKTPFGLALPEEPYSVLPFFSDVLFPSDGAPADERAREAFSLLFDLRFAYGLTPHMCTSDCAVRLFGEGRAPFAMVGEWRVRELEAALGANLGLAPIPALPVSGAKVRSVKRELGLERAGDADPRDRKAADDLVHYLQNDCRPRLAAVLGKVPLPLAAPKDTTTPAARDEAALVAILESGSVEAPEAAVHAAVDTLTPILEQLAQGKIAPSEASRLLLAASGPRAD